MVWWRPFLYFSSRFLVMAVAAGFIIGFLGTVMSALAGGGHGSTFLWWLQVLIVWPALILLGLLCLPLKWLRSIQLLPMLIVYLAVVSLTEIA